MTRWMHPPELGGPRQPKQFDPLLEGERYRLSRDVALAIWNRACADATDSSGRRDDERARQRFHELAARGGRPWPDPGRVTRVGVEIDRDPRWWAVQGVSPPVQSVPGRRTLVEQIENVVQAQQQRTESGGAGPRTSHPHDALEQEAEVLAAQLAPGTAVRTQRLPGGSGAAAAAADALGLSAVTVLQNHEAAAMTAARSVRGLMRHGVVYLRPGIDPDSYEGRYLVAHELAHVAQAKLGGGAHATVADAEGEARTIGEAFAGGRSVPAPRVALREAEAHDTPPPASGNLDAKGPDSDQAGSAPAGDPTPRLPDGVKVYEFLKDSYPERLKEKSFEDFIAFLKAQKPTGTPTDKSNQPDLSNPSKWSGFVQAWIDNAQLAQNSGGEPGGEPPPSDIHMPEGELVLGPETPDRRYPVGADITAHVEFLGKSVLTNAFPNKAVFSWSVKGDKDGTSGALLPDQGIGAIEHKVKFEKPGVYTISVTATSTHFLQPYSASRTFSVADPGKRLDETFDAMLALGTSPFEYKDGKLVLKDNAAALTIDGQVAAIKNQIEAIKQMVTERKIAQSDADEAISLFNDRLKKLGEITIDLGADAKPYKVTASLLSEVHGETMALKWSMYGSSVREGDEVKFTVTIADLTSISSVPRYTGVAKLKIGADETATRTTAEVGALNAAIDDFGASNTYPDGHVKVAVQRNLSADILVRTVDTRNWRKDAKSAAGHTGMVLGGVGLVAGAVFTEGTTTPIWVKVILVSAAAAGVIDAGLGIEQRVHTGTFGDSVATEALDITQVVVSLAGGAVTPFKNVPGGVILALKIGNKAQEIFLAAHIYARYGEIENEYQAKVATGVEKNQAAKERDAALSQLLMAAAMAGTFMLVGHALGKARAPNGAPLEPPAGENVKPELRTLAYEGSIDQVKAKLDQPGLSADERRFLSDVLDYRLSSQTPTRPPADEPNQDPADPNAPKTDPNAPADPSTTPVDPSSPKPDPNAPAKPPAPPPPPNETAGAKLAREAGLPPAEKGYHWAAVDGKPVYKNNPNNKGPRRFYDVNEGTFKDIPGQWDKFGWGDIGKKDPCFPPGVIVMTPRGGRAIETLAVGDEVVVFDHASGANQVRPITAVMQNATHRLTRITIAGGELVSATRLHRFWVAEAGDYLPAMRLEPGMHLHGADGTARAIERVVVEAQDSPTFNLEIDGIHNFFVGGAGVLVHNGDDKVSGFESTTKVDIEIYAIWDKEKQAYIYVGQTDQGIDTRFQQHLNKKPDWKAREQLLEPHFVKRGSWDQYEAAVWELHFIRKYKADGNPLENKPQGDPIAEPKFKKFRDKHNPCR